MPNLSRIKWSRFEPDIDNNRHLPEGQRFYMELARGLSKEEMAAFRASFFQSQISDGLEGEALKKAEADWRDARVASLLPHVRLGKTPLVLDGGEAVATVAQYLGLFAEQASLYQWIELARELMHINSVAGNEALFSARPSGGSSSTADQSSARGEPNKAVH